MKSIGKIDNWKNNNNKKKISEFQVGPPKLHNHEVMTDQMNSVSNQWSETVSEVWPTTHPPDHKNF